MITGGQVIDDFFFSTVQYANFIIEQTDKQNENRISFQYLLINIKIES